MADYSRKKAIRQHFCANCVFLPLTVSDSQLVEKKPEPSVTRTRRGIPKNRTRPIQEDQARPILTGESDGFVVRLKEVVGEESVSSFSRRCGIGESVIRGYLAEGKRPGLDYLVALSDAGGVMVDWLATGRQPKLQADLRDLKRLTGEPSNTPYGPALDPGRLRMALTMAEDAAALIPETLTPEKRADLALTFYQRLAGDTTDGKR